MDILIVLCTFPNPDVARQIGTVLAEAQLAACVNLCPGVRSIYVGRARSSWRRFSPSSRPRAPVAMRWKSIENFPPGREVDDLQTIMLTDDRRAAAEQVGKDLGLPAVFAGLKPEDKVATIKEMTDRGHKVAMVGDGVNDAPSLAAAYVSVDIA